MRPDMSREDNVTVPSEEQKDSTKQKETANKKVPKRKTKNRGGK